MKKAKLMKIKDCLNRQPPPRKWIVEGLIPSAVVGALIGTGGTGKTNFALAMAISIAVGQDFPPFKITKSNRILYVNVEEPVEDIWRRIHAFGNFYPDIKQRLDKLEENLLIYAARGKLGPLMQMTGGNPEPSDDAKALENMIFTLKPDLVILDTKSRLFGLNEDSNDQAAQWGQLMEKMSQDFKCGFLILHHVSKSMAKNASQLASRGASSFVDNARYAISLTPISDEEKQSFCLENPERYFAVDNVKSNYGPPLEKTYFEKLDEGIPQYVVLTSEPPKKIMPELVRLLSNIPNNLTRRELVDREHGKEIRDQLKKRFHSKKEDLKNAIDMALNQGLLEEIEIQGGQDRKELTVVDVDQN